MSDILTHPVFISGASSGIGFALAKEFVQGGAVSLTISGRQKEKLLSAASELSCLGATQINTIVMDQDKRESVYRAAEILIERQASPITLVCNVGVNPVHKDGPKKMQNTLYEQLMETFQVNVANSFLLVQECLSQMRTIGMGRIFLIGSQAYRYGVPGQVSYNISKSALVGLKNTLNSEYGNKDIGCRLFNIGLVDNPRTSRLRKRLADSANEISLLGEDQVARRLFSYMKEPMEVLQESSEVDIA
ncbi:MAG: SDR family oxidoreductase [Pseudomonadales bacterium]|nr:SDR family oxidoreductase [Pseudomonadales bacterium]